MSIGFQKRIIELQEQLLNEQENCKKWKEIAAKLYQCLWIVELRDCDGEHMDIQNARIEYSRCINELP